MANEQSKVQELRAQRQDVETTDAVRLETELAKKQCVHCGQRAWRVTTTRGEVRYVKCRGCGRTDKLVAQRLAECREEAEGSRSEGRNWRAPQAPRQPAEQGNPGETR